MKKIILIVFVLSTLSTKAQYFQHLYGQDPFIGSITKTGMNTTYTGAGHLIGGLHIQDLNTAMPPPFTNFHLYSINVVRTDVDGRFTTINNFNKTYQLTNAAGAVIRFTSGAVVEFSDGSGYGVMGTYFYQPLPRSFGIAYIRLDAMGNVMTTQGYSVPFTGGSGIDLMGLKESTSTPGDLFATGQVSISDNGYMWALRIDQAGGLSWGNLYDFGTGYTEDPKDLIESPYANELIVVGRSTTTTTVKAFWMVIDPNTGGVVQADEMTSFYGTDEYLHSIDVSEDPVIPGFILSGVVDERVWVVKTDQTGNYDWSGLYQPLSRPVDYMYGYDAVGRLKKGTTDNDEYEYFITGPVDEDAYVFKLDDRGQPINPNGLFVYDIGLEETGLDVDVNVSGTADGVTMYAVAEDNNAPTREMYAVKAYFNGVSGCNETFEDLQYNIAEFGNTQPIAINIIPLSTEQLDFYNENFELDVELCHNTTVPGGSNARIAPNAPEGEKENTISPNPITNGTSYASLEVEVNEPTSVTVSIYDMLGRTYYTHNFNLVKGTNNLSLNISEANMAAGMYSVKIEGKKLNKNIMLMVK